MVVNKNIITSSFVYSAYVTLYLEKNMTIKELDGTKYLISRFVGIKLKRKDIMLKVKFINSK